MALPHSLALGAYSCSVEDAVMLYGDNNNCDGSGPHTSGEVRVMPLAGGGNLIVCLACYLRELHWRRGRNEKVASPYDLPTWKELEVYGPSRAV